MMQQFVGRVAKTTESDTEAETGEVITREEEEVRSRYGKWEPRSRCKTMRVNENRKR